ncbi:MAG: hypothetical protein JW743_10855 [Deltaproteobacteria bacterium]|nr:hypothetical protein [Deltaproteobacteria bacterium]
MKSFVMALSFRSLSACGVAKTMVVMRSIAALKGKEGNLHLSMPRYLCGKER